MDPNQTIGATPSELDNVDPTGSNSRTETLPVGPTGALVDPRSILTTRSHFGSGKDLDPDRTGARVWNRPGERQAADDLTRRQSTRPISPTPKHILGKK
ncbi:hypothetical protein F2Q70_00026435 [Brassica cretica]|uniref:Uncharacterized protein n=1 Tax=Brassica cretica TaxID=69181 RepID=A0A8S9LC67_BRACR|nr:hypothetical protein F2Q70_00026435 [Brassica cretica]